MATETLAPVANPPGFSQEWFEQAAEAAGRIELAEPPPPEPIVSVEQAEEQIRQFEQEGGE